MSSRYPRRIEVEDIGDVAVVRFVDRERLDEYSIQEIGVDLFRLVDELGRRKVVLNFGNVEFMSSAALGTLITLHRKLQAVRGKLVLCEIAGGILDVFKIVKLPLPITRTEAEALERLPAPGATGPVRRHDCLTPDDIRRIEVDGLTLGDAIRQIEAPPR